MHNGGSQVNISEKLRLDPQVRELKFGSSFSPKGPHPSKDSFHTIRYDFKPASVDTSQMASLEVDPNSQVTIAVPNSDGTGSNVFKGPKKPYTKECVLIIDHETGEIVLEKVTNNMLLKKTRQEGISKISNKQLVGNVPSLPPSIPSDTYKSLKGKSASQSSRGRKDMEEKPRGNNKTREHNPTKINVTNRLGLGSASINNAKQRSNSPVTALPQKHSPLISPGEYSPDERTVSNFESSTKPVLSSQKLSMAPSLRGLEEFINSDLVPEASPPPTHRSAKLEGVKSGHIDLGKSASSTLSEGSSESSSSSSSESDSSSDDEEMELVPEHVPTSVAKCSAGTSTYLIGNHKDEAKSTVSNTMSMPSLLSEDLQLSESGSDIDD